MAQSTDMNTITGSFSHALQNFANTATVVGENLAYSLAVLTLILSIILMIIQGDELNKMFSKLLQTVLLFGLFFTLIKTSGSWIPKIINSFMAIGGKSAGLTSLTPGSVFNVGVNIANKMFHLSNQVAIYHIGVIMGGLFCGFFVLIIYAFITAEVIIVLIKSYTLVAVGPLIFALGNSDFTRSAVTNYIRKVIGMGIHLMILYVIVGVGNRLGDIWIKQFLHSGYMDFLISAVLPMIGGLIVLYLVMKNVPAFIAELSGAGGFRNYGDAAVAAAVAGAGALTKAITSAGKTASGGYKGLAGTAGGIGGGIAGARENMRNYAAINPKDNTKLRVLKTGAHGLVGGVKGGYTGFGKGTNYAHNQINTVKKSVQETVTGSKDK